MQRKQERKEKLKYTYYIESNKYLNNHITCKWFQYFGHYVLCCCCLVAFILRQCLTYNSGCFEIRNVDHTGLESFPASAPEC